MTGRSTRGRIVRSSLKGNRMFSSPTRSNAGKTGHRLVVTGVVAALALGMTACGGGGSDAPAAAKAPDASALSKAGGVTTVTFWHAMDGTNAEVLTKLVDAFNKTNAGKIKVEATYVGKYDDAIAKYKASIQSKSTPDVVQVYDIGTRFMIDAGQTVPMQDFIDRDKVDMSDLQPNIAGYYSVDKKLYSMPFNTSMPVLYINQKLFKEAGLDPNHAPETWKEMAEYAQKLTKRDASGKVMQWGVQIPASGFPYWLFQGLTTENGVQLMNAAGTETYYDKPAVIEAVQYWVDLTSKYKAHPEGIVEWGTTPKDFFERKVAMMWTTTGNLTNVRSNAKFDFGVAMLPANKRRGSPTGGGNFYLFKQTKPEQQAAAFKFVKWITSPARAAQWGIDTGYVAVRPDAWETPEMKKYVAEFPPAAVARDQLQFAVAELSTHDNQRVTKALNDGLQAALTGSKPAEQAMKDAQREADRLLKSYRK